MLYNDNINSNNDNFENSNNNKYITNSRKQQQHIPASQARKPNAKKQTKHKSYNTTIL